jgi:hypothetical protein
VDLSQEVLQARIDATADEVRSFARGYASAVESHCLSLLQCLVELRLQCRNQNPPTKGSATAGPVRRLWGDGIHRAVADVRVGLREPERQGRDPPQAGQPGGD